MSTEIDPASLQIITFPHPTLRQKAQPVRRVDANLKSIIARMFELMYAHRGVGLAATQVDLPMRIFVMNESGCEGDGEPMALINPVLSKMRGNEEAEEGCLSLPGVHGNVIRAKQLHLEAYDLKGNQISRDVEGFEARIMQHETDHLNGTLFFDRMPEGNLGEVEPQLALLDTEFRSKQKTEEIASDDALLEQFQLKMEVYC